MIIPSLYKYHLQHTYYLRHLFISRVKYPHIAVLIKIQQTLRSRQSYTRMVLGQNPPGQNPPGQNPPRTKSPRTKSPRTKSPHYIPPNCSIAQYFLLYINVIFEGQFFKPLLDVIYSMVMKWRSVAERSRSSKCVCSQDLNSESDCFPPLPLFYMDSETMGDRNVRCLSLIGCY